MTAKGGKSREALAVLKEGVEYVRSKHGLKAEAYMQLYGVAGTIYVIDEYTDAASAQAAQAKLMADDGYMALVQRLAELIVDPPTITLLQSV